VSKLTPGEAVHKHERNMHAGKPLTPMKTGGVVGDTNMNKPKTMPKLAKGGRACMAAGGVGKIRHKQATPAGAPKAAPKRFKKGGLI
jgi:hypothetical protein